MPGYFPNMNIFKNNNHLRHAFGKGKKRLLTPQRERHFGDACVFDCECVIVLELGLAAHHVEREILLNAVFSPIEGL